MRKLTDVYIKATNGNVKELMKQINRYDLEPNFYIYFISENIKGNCVSIVEPKNKQKVSLSQLKRLIDTIPTRDEIVRLKRQISAYKTNYDKVVKHSLSKEDVIEDLQNNNSELIQKLFKANRDLKNKCNENYRLKDDIKKVRGERDSLNASFKSINEMYDDALKEIEVWKDNDKKSLELIKEMNDDNDILVDCMEKLDDKLELTERKLNIQADLIRDKNAQLEQLKQRKWWQIWK